MKKQSTIIAVVNQKGGTAKTTTVENLGIGLSRQNKKVLLIDTDPQASLTISLGYPRPDDLELTLSDLLNGTISENPVALDEVLIHQREGIDLIPSNISLAGLEVSLVNTMNRERILKTSSFFSHQDPNMVEWFVKMVEERKKNNDSSKEKKNW